MSNKDLDKFLAVEVMGWELRQAPAGHDIWWGQPDEKFLRPEEWRPTQDMNQAMMCVEKMAEKGFWKFTIYRLNHILEYDKGPTPHESKRWECIMGQTHEAAGINAMTYIEEDDSPEMAICKAIKEAMSDE